MIHEYIRIRIIYEGKISLQDYFRWREESNKLD